MCVQGIDMNIAILNGYVRENKGDAALMSILAHQLQEAFPEANVVISSAENPLFQKDFEGFKTVGSMRLYTAEEHIFRVQRILRKIFVLCIDALWPITPLHRRLVRFLPLGIRGELGAIEDADLIVLMGGGYLNARETILGNLNILFLTIGARIAERLGKVVILAPQSFGPFQTGWQRRRIRRVLNATKLVCVREDKSFNLLKNIGIKKELMIRAVDLGFAYRPLSAPKPQNSRMRIGITARQWLHLSKQKKYEQALADFICYAEKKYGAEVILVPQVTSNRDGDDDRIVETRIKKLAELAGAHPTQITEELAVSNLKDVYATFTFTVGTRFHSVIFSLTSYVPSIAIEYEHKTSGILQDLGLEEWSIKIEDVTADALNEMFDKLVVNKDSYIQHLKVVLPTYINKATKVPELIQKIYAER